MGICPGRYADRRHETVTACVVYDDRRNARERLGTMFAAVPGLRVIGVASADELIRRFVGDPGPLAVVGTQRAVPSGLDAIRRLLAVRPSAAVIAVGSADDCATAGQCGGRCGRPRVRAVGHVGRRHPEPGPRAHRGEHHGAVEGPATPGRGRRHGPRDRPEVRGATAGTRAGPGPVGTVSSGRRCRCSWASPGANCRFSAASVRDSATPTWTGARSDNTVSATPVVRQAGRAEQPTPSPSPTAAGCSPAPAIRRDTRAPPSGRSRRDDLSTTHRRARTVTIASR